MTDGKQKIKDKMTAGLSIPKAMMLRRNTDFKGEVSQFRMETGNNSNMQCARPLTSQDGISQSLSSCDETVHSGSSFDEKCGCDPSLISMIDGKDWDQVLSLITRAPLEAALPMTVVIAGEETKTYPLHILTNLSRVPTTVLHSVLVAFPNACSVPATSTGMLPLHLACRNKKIPATFIQELINAFPHACKSPDADGFLPVHYAAQSASPMEVVEALLKVYPDAVRVSTKDGKLPLHLVVSRARVDNASMRTILKMYPEAAAVPDCSGRYPLHLSCQFQSSTYVVAALAHAHPTAVRITDNTFCLPQDLLIRGGSQVTDPRFQVLQSVNADLSTARDSKDNGSPEGSSIRKKQSKFFACKIKSALHLLSGSREYSKRLTY